MQAQNIHDAAQLLQGMLAVSASLVIVGTYMLYKRWPR